MSNSEMDALDDRLLPRPRTSDCLVDHPRPPQRIPEEAYSHEYKHRQGDGVGGQGGATEDAREANDGHHADYHFCQLLLSLGDQVVPENK